MRSFPLTKVNSRHPRPLQAAAFSAVESLETRRLFAAVMLEETPPVYSYGNANTPETVGEVMATRGNKILIGRPNTDVFAPDDQIGAVTLFNTANNAVTTIENPDAQLEDEFGNAVTFITDNLIAIGSVEFNNTGLNTIFLFTIDEAGNETAAGTIVAPSGDIEWGNSLSSINGQLLVSAPSAGTGAGAVYRYNAVNAAPAEQIYTLLNSTDFGRAMAVDDAGDRLVFSSQDANSERRVVEMDLGGTVVRNYIESGSNPSNDSFSLGFAGDTVVIGDVNANRVSQFERSITGPGDNAGLLIREIAGNGLGLSIATSDSTFTVTDFDALAHVYDTETGEELAIADEGSHTFGSAVGALSGNRIAVNDPFGADLSGTGNLYVFDLNNLGGEPTAPPVQGTAGNDTIRVTQSGSTITVTVNGLASVFTGDRLVIEAGTGNDIIGVAGNVSIPVEAYGGEGNDLISGGSQADILVGGNGNDVILGGAGRDVLIGGNGADIILGLADDDVLIAGSTAHDEDPAALRQILAVWTNSNSYSARVDALQADLLAASNVFDDNAIDILAGNAGTDWFLFNNDGPNARDRVLDRKSAEEGTDLTFVPA